MKKNTQTKVGSGIKKRKVSGKEKTMVFLIDTITMILNIFKWIAKHFWKLFFIILVIFLVSKYLSWNNQRMALVSNYWDEQEQICGFGYITETGDRADCHPSDYLTAR